MQKRDGEFDIQKTFFMTMQTSFTNTGLLSATVSFHNPLNIYYNETLLGNITLPDVNINGGYGSLNTETPFYIEDTDYFSAFSSDMLTFDKFDWTMKGQADVTGVGRTITIDVDKTFSIQGMGGFKDVNIQSFNLPGNDPKGGVLAELGIVMKNPSPIGVQLGNIALQMGYQDANFGVLQADNVTLTQGDNAIQLKGSIKPIQNKVDLDKFSEMLTTYMSGGVAPTYAMGLSASPDSKSPIRWLTNSFHAVKLNAPLFNPNGPIQVLRGINMSSVHMEIDPFNVNEPLVSAPSIMADIKAPFGFNFEIYETSHEIIIGTNKDGPFSTVHVPWTPSQYNNKTGKLQFSIHGANVVALSEKKQIFEAYAKDLSNKKVDAVNLQGVATARAKTPVGDLTLGGIPFQVGPVVPSLSTRLIQYTDLKVLPDTLKTNITGVAVSMINPFPVPLSVLKIASNVTYKGIGIGSINQDISATPFTIPSRSNATSPHLPMNMPLAPAPVAFLLRDLAVESRLNTTTFDALLGMCGLHLPGQQNVSATSDVFKGFDLVNFTMSAMKALKVDLGVQSTLRIGQDVSNMNFTQLGVPVHTDKSIADLIPVIGQSLVQKLIDGAKMDISRVKLYHIHNHKAKVKLKGKITNAGPIDSKLSFPKPLTIHWRGKKLGKLHMPSIDVKADKGAHFNVHAHLHITHENNMEDFAEHLLKKKHFRWHITDKHLSVTALGYTFKDVNLDKHVKLRACKGFKDDVKIHDFDLPSDHKDGGIKLEVWSSIHNQADLGVEADEIGFHVHYKGVYIGPLHTHKEYLKARHKTHVKLHGRILHQDSQDGLDAVSELVDHYVHAKDSHIELKGHYVKGPKGKVRWLTRAIKKLKVKHIKLPGAKHELDLIPHMTLKDAKLDFTDSHYSPPLSSDRTTAEFDNPWGCTVEIKELKMDATLSYNGRDTAKLNLPYVDSYMESRSKVVTSFYDAPLKSINDDSFEDFFKDITEHSRTDFKLRGYVTAYAHTAAGRLKIPDVYFNVETYLDGFNNFDGQCTVSDVKIVGGTPEAIQSTLQVSFYNPSQITAKTGDIYLDAIMDEFNAVIGKVTLPDAKIYPGTNVMSATMDIASTNVPALQQLLSDFMTGAYIPLDVHGTHDSTHVGSLRDAFSTIDLDTSLTGIPANLVSTVQAVITPAALQTGIGETTVTLHNPLDTPVTLRQADVDVFFPVMGEDGEMNDLKIGEIHNISSPCYIPAGESTVCDPWSIQLLATPDQLQIVLHANDTSVNLQQNITVTLGEYPGFTGGFYYWEDHVNTVFDASALNATSPTAATNTTGTANTTNTTVPVGAPVDAPAGAPVDATAVDDTTTTTTPATDSQPISTDASDQITPTNFTEMGEMDDSSDSLSQHNDS
ncbi:unnamed protein product [Cunninghamella echinulata]